MFSKRLVKKTTYLVTMIVLGLYCSTPNLGGDVPTIGDAAPEIELEALLQAPDGAATTWAALSGKVVVLEFWATWCVPCIAEFPHLSKLAGAFEKTGDVVFISITDESRDTIEKFLESTPLDTWVGIDKDRSTFDRYKIVGMPQAIIIDKQGKVAAVTFPSMISEQVLRDVAAGKPANLPSGSFDEMSEFALAQTAPGKEHEVLERLAGYWIVETTKESMIPGSSETTTTSHVTRFWVLGGRVLQSRSVMETGPRIERLAMLGYDAEKDQYFMDEYSPLESAPLRWTGRWDEAGSTLRFERAVEIRMMGGPPGEQEEVDETGAMAGTAMQAAMALVIELDAEDSYKTTVSMELPDMSKHLPPGAMMTGHGSTGQILSKSVATRNDRQ